MIWPRAHSRPRPPVVSSGSQKYIQLCLRCARSRGQASGVLIQVSLLPAASFEQQNAGALVFGQAARQRTAGGTGADDDDVVILIVRHDAIRLSEL